MKKPDFTPLFSFFRGPITNLTPELQPLDLRAVHALVTGPRLKELTEELRAAAGTERARIKKRLPYVTGAGTFPGGRQDAHLARFSRCLLLDMDKLADPAAVRAALLADPQLLPLLQMIFISPSGNGLKLLLAAAPAPLPSWPEPHENGASDLTVAQAREVMAANFNGYALYLKARHGLEADSKATSLSHACFLCFDPEAWLSPEW